MRGEVNGDAQVEWVREGSRYQVHLDVTIGPSFAPLMSRRMVSQGELSDLGLVPRRYEERTRIGFSVRDLVLIGGGLFLLVKGTLEIHDSVEGRGDGAVLVVGLHDPTPPRLGFSIK